MLTIREANKQDGVVVAEHLRLISLELGCLEASIRHDWQEKTIQFIERARQELSYRCFYCRNKRRNYRLG